MGAYLNDADDNSFFNSGAAYLFDLSDLELDPDEPVVSDSLTEAVKLTASDATGSDRFGYSVGLSGSTAIVGAYLNDDPSNSGSAYLYTPAPVPLPASLWLLGEAVGGAAGLRRVAQRRRT